MKRRDFIKNAAGVLVPIGLIGLSRKSLAMPGSPYLSYGWTHSSGASFSPSSLNPLLWYKQSSIDGTTTWTDSGSKAANMTHSGSPTQSNGVSITYNGTSQYSLAATVASIASPFTWFARMSQISWVLNAIALGSSNVQLYQAGTTPQLNYFSNGDGGAGNAANGNLPADGTFHTVVFAYSSGACSIQVDSTTKVNGTVGGTNTITDAFVGAQGAGPNSYCNMAVKEIVLLSGVTTGTDLTNMLTYMAGLA